MLSLACLSLAAYILFCNREAGPSFSGVGSSVVQANSLDLPENITFAGEGVPLADEDVYERFDKELTLSTYFQSHTLMLMKRSHRWFPQIEPILQQYHIPDDFKYVAAIESMFENKASPRGAAGFWQIMEPAGREFGLEITPEVDERYHPVKATHAACKYFIRVYKFFGNWTSALASYNVGIGSMYRSIQSQKMKSYYDLLVNTETSRYVFRLLALKEIMQNGPKYGFNIKKNHYYQAIPVRTVKVTETIADLAAWSISQGINYKILKLYNPWLRKNSLTVKQGKVYEIEIPKKVNMSVPASDLYTLSDSLADDSAAPSGEPAADASRPFYDAADEADPAPVTTNPGGPSLKKEQSLPRVLDRPADRPLEKQPENASGNKTKQPGTAAKPAFHIVRRGESLSVIAEKYGTSEKALIRINKLKKLQVQVGQKLKLE